MPSFGSSSHQFPPHALGGVPGRPPRLLLQWHLTDRCNLRCSHCYQADFRDGGLDFAAWCDILAQFRAFIAPGEGRPAIRGHITVTGGEPFVRDDFPALLDRFAAEREHYSFAILSNGTLIDDALARRLAAWAPAFVQVSLDGGEATHDAIRGAGAFRRARAALVRLVAAGVPSVVAFTAHRANYGEFAEVSRLGCELGVSRVWADRLIPEGETQRSQSLSPEETRRFVETMQSLRTELRPYRTEIAMKRALQFLAADDAPYRCTAGDTLVTVLPNGDVYPCRRLPIRVGNLLETPLAQLYDGSTLRALRDPAALPDACAPCAFASVCRGGLRCLSYAMTGDTRQADPGCWLLA